MASKYRPKGSYKDFLNLDASEISALSESTLRGIVNKLNDAANKRIKRLRESGYAELSPSVRGLAKSGKGTFKLTGKETMSQLKGAYVSAKYFLRPEGTSTRKGIEAHNKQFEDAYEKVLGRKFNDARNFDQRYKNKKVLKKSVKKKLRDFWTKYDKWREVEKEKYPDSAKGATNLENVQEFEEELYSTGQTDIASMEKAATDKYLKAERAARGDANDEGDISINTADGRRAKSSKPSKHKKPGKTKKSPIKQRFEKIKIL